MKGDVETSGENSGVLAELRALEPLIYAANGGKGREHFEKLLIADFWEVGASGQRYSRDFVLGVLEDRQRNPREEAWQASEHHLRRLADGCYLLTYLLQQPTRKSRRATVWQKVDQGWVMVYHQGTVVVES